MTAPACSATSRHRLTSVATLRGASIAAVAAVAIVVAMLLVGCAKQQATSASLTKSGVVSLWVPSGWTKSTDGLTVAKSEADLAADVPQGPRVRAVVGPGNDDPAAMAAQAMENPSRLGAEPEGTTVDSYDATSIAIVEDSANGSLVTGYLFVTTAPGESVVFVLQAPESQWEQVKATLVDVPKFD